ncbi:MAG: PspC domain-containing protein [Candidatus Thorarchaeota archaeon]
MADNYETPPDPLVTKTLYRRAHDKKLAGVCGGLADYFEIDATLVRVFWVLGSLFYLMGLIGYIVLALVIPVEPTADVHWSPEGSGGPGLE